jgi:hypothetical protein
VGKYSILCCDIGCPRPNSVDMEGFMIYISKQSRRSDCKLGPTAPQVVSTVENDSERLYEERQEGNIVFSSGRC